MMEDYSFAAAILKWFEQNKRPLPWRETHDPYAIWLSEVILQQTRVEQGLDYWQSFMKRWPTVEKLAQATQDEVLRQWQGLGYYTRARNLHEAAQQIVRAGHFPDNTHDIRQLKGVGDYTAAAIASIAFGLPEAVVDGNVYRVLARHFGIDTPINTNAGKKTFATLAKELLPHKQTSDYNQGLMDFGAIQCTPSSPHCHTCPIAHSCVALNTGRTNSLPVKQRKNKVKTRHLTYYYIRCNGQVAFHRRKPGDIWQGLWEPLLIEQHKTNTKKDLTTPFAPQDSTTTLIAQELKHVLTHQVLRVSCLLVETTEKPKLPDDFIWIKEEDIEHFGIPRIVEILMEKIAQTTNSQHHNIP